MTLNYAKIKEQMYGLDSAYIEIQKIKPRKKNKSYRGFLNHLLKKKINDLIKQIQNVSLKKKLVKKAGQDKFLYETYILSKNEKIDFEKVLLKKVLNKMKNQQDVINDSSVQILINEYQISL